MSRTTFVVFTSRPYVGLWNTTTLGSKESSRARMHFLDVPARERARPCGDAGGAHVEVSYELLGAPVDDRPLDPTVPPERPLTDPLEDEIQPTGSALTMPSPRRSSVA